MSDLESSYTFQRDEKHLVKMNDEETDNFYDEEEKLSEVINIVVPEGSRNYLDLKIGDENLKLCQTRIGKCYRTKVVVLASKFPGFALFAKHYQINFLEPQVLISEN